MGCVCTPAHSMSAESYPSKLAHSAASLKSAFVRISTKDMSAFLDRFTAFYTRYYRSPTGRESQLFLLGHLQEVSILGAGNAALS